MNKTIAMMIKETKMKLASVCNESGLSPAILDLILQSIYTEVHYLAEKQMLDDEKAYTEKIKDADSSN